MACGHIERQNSHPDQHAARHQEQHQLHRAVFFGAGKSRKVGAAAPYPDQQVHRQHCQLIEKEEEEQVLNYEHAKHAGTQRQQQHKEIPRPSLDGLGNQHCAKQDNAVEQHQRGGNSIHRQGKVNI